MSHNQVKTVEFHKGQRALGGVFLPDPFITAGDFQFECGRSR
jgi:hypothetical protein